MNMNEVNYSVAANLWAIPTYWEYMILSLGMALQGRRKIFNLWVPSSKAENQKKRVLS